MSDALCVLLVYSTSHALRIEKILKEKGIGCKLVPVPRLLSSDCGICIRFREEDREQVEKIVETTGIETPGIYSL